MPDAGDAHPASSRTRIFAVLAAGCAVGPFSWMGGQFIFGLGSRWWPGTIPGFTLTMFAAGISQSLGFSDWATKNVAPFLVGPILFFCLSFPLFRGTRTVPTASFIALLWLTGLALVLAIGGLFTGPQVQGPGNTARVLLMEGAGLGLSWVVFALARRNSSFAYNVLFHWAVVSWLVWLAFPILGHFEGP